MDGNNGIMRKHATFVSDPRGSGHPSPPEVFCPVPLKSPTHTCGFPPYLPPLNLRRRVLSDTGDSLGPLAPPLTPLTAGCVRTPPWDPWDPPALASLSRVIHLVGRTRGPLSLGLHFFGQRASKESEVGRAFRSSVHPNQWTSFP